MATIMKDTYSVNEKVLVGSAQVPMTIKEFFSQSLAVVYVSPGPDRLGALFVANISDFRKIDA